ncbi:MAG: diguanylate cyclase, partial [Candidatus Obscuribacterales bacterium]|nr:diguanylate cyclase [Candidatus Obscuribacterales bacterium]
PNNDPPDNAPPLAPPLAPPVANQAIIPAPPTPPVIQAFSKPEPQKEAQSEPQQATDMFRLGIPDHVIALESARANSVSRILNKPETGILTFEVFHYFLDREFARAFRFQTILSLVTFCVRPTISNDESMPTDSLAMLTGAVSSIKRDVDMFGHFGSRAFGILLPCIESSQACVLADRISSELPRLAPDLAKHRPVLHFGIASVPQDAQDLSSLVQKAQSAMMAAANQNILRVQAIELQ